MREWIIIQDKGGYHMWEGEDEYSEPKGEELTFNTLKELIDKALLFEGVNKFTDVDSQGTIFTSNGKVTTYLSYMGSADKFIKKFWVDRPEPEYEEYYDEPAPKCSLCRDGGCHVCQPRLFL